MPKIGKVRSKKYNLQGLDFKDYESMVLVVLKDPKDPTNGKMTTAFTTKQEIELLKGLAEGNNKTLVQLLAEKVFQTQIGAATDDKLIGICPLNRNKKVDPEYIEVDERHFINTIKPAVEDKYHEAGKWPKEEYQKDGYYWIVTEDGEFEDVLHNKDNVYVGDQILFHPGSEPDKGVPGEPLGWHIIPTHQSVTWAMITGDPKDSENLMKLFDSKEDDLGKPETTGEVLTSTKEGVRSWAKGVPGPDEDARKQFKKVQGTANWNDEPPITLSKTKTDLAGKENDLGAPDKEGQVLSSDKNKKRTWVDLPDPKDKDVRTAVSKLIDGTDEFEKSKDKASQKENYLGKPTKAKQVLTSDMEGKRGWIDLPEDKDAEARKAVAVHENGTEEFDKIEKWNRKEDWTDPSNIKDKERWVLSSDNKGNKKWQEDATNDNIAREAASMMNIGKREKDIDPDNFKQKANLDETVSVVKIPFTAEHVIHDVKHNLNSEEVTLKLLAKEAGEHKKFEEVIPEYSPVDVNSTEIDLEGLDIEGVSFIAIISLPKVVVKQELPKEKVVLIK